MLSLFGLATTSKQSSKHKSCFIIFIVSDEAVAVRAITGTEGPAKERNFLSLP